MTYEDAVISAQITANEDGIPCAVGFDRKIDKANAEKFGTIAQFENISFKSLRKGTLILHLVYPNDETKEMIK